MLTVEPRAQGRVLGFPVRVDELAISMEDPEGLCAALGLEFEAAETGTS